MKTNSLVWLTPLLLCFGLSGCGMYMNALVDPDTPGLTVVNGLAVPVCRVSL